MSFLALDLTLAVVAPARARGRHLAARTHMETATSSLDGVAIPSLEPGTTLLVCTRNSRYRLTVLDSATDDVLVEGGRLFLDARPARLDGATAGGTALRTRWVGVGLRMEMSSGGKRITTSPVQSIEIERHMPHEPSGARQVAGKEHAEHRALVA